MLTIPRSTTCGLVCFRRLPSVWRRRPCKDQTLAYASTRGSVQRSVESSQAQASNRLPRFHYEAPLPAVVGSCLQLDTTESKHATRVLRLTDNTLVEVCNGRGEIVIGKLVTNAKAAAHVVTTTGRQQVAWQGHKWELAVACGSLQNSRADWLIEKCTELGAWSFRPILTERSPGIGWKGMGKASKVSPEDGGRIARWRRIADAASKQSLRAHNVILQPAVTVEELVQHVASAPSAWVGAAGGAPLRDQSVKLPASAQSDREAAPRLLIIGPEGDFTMAELKQLTLHGAELISLGSHRLRVETAALAMLSAAQLHT